MTVGPPQPGDLAEADQQHADANERLGRLADEAHERLTSNSTAWVWNHYAKAANRTLTAYGADPIIARTLAGVWAAALIRVASAPATEEP